MQRLSHAVYIGLIHTILTLYLLLFATHAAGNNTTSGPVTAGLALHDARLLSALPDAPVMAIGYRSTPRGKVSAIIPIAGHREAGRGFFLQLIPLIELHNAHRSSQVIPYEKWRGRLSLEGGWTWSGMARKGLLSGSTLRITLGLDHESDHHTNGYYSGPAAVVHNNASLRGAVALPLSHVWQAVATLALVERVHLLTCTVANQRCYTGSEGSATFETGAEAVLDWGGADPGRHSVRPFAAAAMYWLVENAKAKQERRLALRAGVRLRRPGRGMWQLYLHLLAGNDVGIERQEDVLHLGVGLAWAP